MGIHCHPSNANGVGCVDDAHAGISSQRTTQTLAMHRLVNSQAAQNHDWKNHLSHGARSTASVPSTSFTFPGCGCAHGLKQTVIRFRWHIQSGVKLLEGLRTGSHDYLVEQDADCIAMLYRGQCSN
jgi:hypothetical protein